MNRDPLSAVRGILNGAALGVILWAAITAILFYGFRVAL